MLYFPLQGPHHSYICTVILLWTSEAPGYFSCGFRFLLWITVKLKLVYLLEEFSFLLSWSHCVIRPLQTTKAIFFIFTCFQIFAACKSVLWLLRHVVFEILYYKWPFFSNPIPLRDIAENGFLWVCTSHSFKVVATWLAATTLVPHCSQKLF